MKSSPVQWTNSCSLKAHTKSISTISVLGDCIVTGSSDSSVKVWKVLKGAEKGIIP